MYVALLDIAVTALEIIRQACPEGAGRNTTLGHALRFVIYPSTFKTHVERVG